MIHQVIREAIDLIDAENYNKYQKTQWEQAQWQATRSMLKVVTRKMVTSIIKEATDDVYLFEDHAISLADSILKST